MKDKNLTAGAFVNGECIAICRPGKTCKEGDTYCKSLKRFITCKWELVEPVIHKRILRKLTI